MGELNIYYVDLKGRDAERIDREALAAASQTENMLPLSAREFEQHRVGIFAAEELWAGPRQKLPPIGYAACRKIVQWGAAPGLPAGEPTSYLAVIGSLYVAPDFRGAVVARAHGQKVTLAQKLVQMVTNRAFRNFSEVEMCVAACNQASLGAFLKCYVQPEEKLAHALGEAIGATADKTIVAINRADW
jgi:GNAT superfamily N-acetyltransferase